MASERNTKNILIRYAIGTGIIMLGLMAFSSICWWVCISCPAHNPLRRLGFWELLGAAILTSIGFFVLLTLRRRHNGGKGTPDHSHDPPAPLTPTASGRQGSWRELYQQLSHDEREKLKEMMAKYCADDISQPASNLQDGALGAGAWKQGEKGSSR